jgi:hypothetical protein
MEFDECEENVDAFGRLWARVVFVVGAVGVVETREELSEPFHGVLE